MNIRDIRPAGLYCSYCLGTGKKYVVCDSYSESGLTDVDCEYCSKARAYPLCPYCIGTGLKAVPMGELD